MNIVKATIAAAATLSLAACAGTGHGDKQVAGTIIGAGAGAVAGAQFGSGHGRLAATAIGTLLGAFAGNAFGESLDRADRLYAARAQTTALESAPAGQTITWNNPDSGHYGNVTPTRTWQDQSGAYCREYQQTIFVGGQSQSGYGRACRQPDGSWQVVN